MLQIKYIGHLGSSILDTLRGQIIMTQSFSSEMVPRPPPHPPPQSFPIAMVPPIPVGARVYFGHFLFC